MSKMGEDRRLTSSIRTAKVGGDRSNSSATGDGEDRRRRRMVGGDRGDGERRRRQETVAAAVAVAAAADAGMCIRGELEFGFCRDDGAFDARRPLERLV